MDVLIFHFDLQPKEFIKNYALYWKFCFEIFTVCLTHFPPKMFIQMHPFREFPLKDKEVVFSAFYIFISKSVGCEIPM